jgi:hypothetical protein
MQAICHTSHSAMPQPRKCSAVPCGSLSTWKRDEPDAGGQHLDEAFAEVLGDDDVAHGMEKGDVQRAVTYADYSERGDAILRGVVSWTPTSG